MKTTETTIKFLLCFVLLAAICLPAKSQHFGGVYFSSDFIPSPKSSILQKDRYFNDHNFNWGFTAGYQAIVFQKKRISFGYGLQYSQRSTQEYYNGPWCATGLTTETVIPMKLDEHLKNIEIPLSVRLNILKTARFQPYASFGIILAFPIDYQATMTYSNGESEPYTQKTDSFKNRLDGLLEGAAGLNYVQDKFLINLHLLVRHKETQGKLGIGLGITRKF